MLRVEHLTTQAFNELDFHVSEGICTAITGPSGSGKTTLLNAIAGIISYQGEICLDEKSINTIPPWQRPCRYLNQRLYLFPYLTVAGNLALAQYAAGLPRSRQKQMSVLDDMGIAHLADCYPRQISGGEQQRAALARALVSRPRLLLLDEPFSNLDWGIRSRLWEIVRGLRQYDVTVILVTHEPKEAEYLAETQWVFQSGKLHETRN
ncbi:ATP-binding cassette domain-containing protein [Klebsiella indica]|uniref:ATP-binding cassette domain-containing protein n=1 Tax=Klebsiella indica TaxID=2582917 RepID=A0A5R9LQZ6_9ENTR|nr:ATP-binding cassette domain-containing protein [Klebsiella indica]TLV23078.1 ATP-binding cassette domain-containing protein [Klebsiella indica]